jgi:hypothetical protein
MQITVKSDTVDSILFQLILKLKLSVLSHFKIVFFLSFCCTNPPFKVSYETWANEIWKVTTTTTTTSTKAALFVLPFSSWKFSFGWKAKLKQSLNIHKTSKEQINFCWISAELQFCYGNFKLGICQNIYSEFSFWRFFKQNINSFINAKQIKTR